MTTTLWRQCRFFPQFPASSGLTLATVFGLWVGLTVAIAGSGAGCGLFGTDSDPPIDDSGIGASCEATSDCINDLVCASGSCQQIGATGLGGPCWASRDCGDDLYCTPAGICGRAGDGEVGSDCITGAECHKDLVCVLVGFSGTCQEAGDADVGESCETNAECLGGLVCAPDGTCQHGSVAYPPFTGVDCAPDDDTAPLTGLFDVPRSSEANDADDAEFFGLPFPNDIRVSSTGALNMSGFPRPGPNILGVDLVSLYTDELVANFEGFGATTPVQFRFSRRLNFDSAVPIVVDVTAGAPEYGQTRGRSWAYREAAEKFRCQQHLVVQPERNRPLLANHTYAVYFTDQVRDADGGAIARSGDFDSVLDSSRPSDAILGAAWDQYQPFRDYLADGAIGLDPDTISVAAVYTVADTIGRDRALAAAMLAAPTPSLDDLTLCDGATSSPCEDADGRGACSAPDPDFYEFHARVAVPLFQQGTPPFATPADGGGIQFVGGVPQQAGSQDVCVALTIPRTQPMPAAGWPLVVASHGTGGSFTNVMQSGVAKTAATAPNPIALLSYDGIAHGERKNGSTVSSDNLVFNILNPQAGRDNHAQGAAEIVYLLRLPEVGDLVLGGPGTVRFDPGNLYFFGHSQGANVGIPAIAIADQVRGAIFSGAGSHLATGMMTKTNPIDSRAGLELLIGDELSTTHPVISNIQHVFTSVEVANFAPLLNATAVANGLTPKNIWMSYGLGDTFSPPATLAITAGAARLDVVGPALEDIELPLIARPVSGNGAAGTFAAVFQATPASGSDGHFVATQNAQMIADWSAFLQSMIATGTATVP